MEGAVSDGGGGDDAELRSYLVARLLWNPGADVVDEIHGFMDAVYGAAAPIMRDYFALGRREVRHGQHLWIDQDVCAPYLTDSFLRHGRALLERAAMETSTDGSRRRVDRHLLSIDYVEAMKSLRYRLTGKVYAPADELGAGTRLPDFIRRADSMGITHLREGYPIAQQVRDWSDLTTPHNAISLAEGGTQATVIPDLAGRIISFGTPNCLRVPDPGELGYPNAGGIQIGLFDAGTGEVQVIGWRVASVTGGSVELTGETPRADNILMRIKIVGGTLQVGVSAMNSALSPARLGFLCTAEFACGRSRDVTLSYLDRSGTAQNRSIRHSDGSAYGHIAFSAGDVPRQGWMFTCARGPALQIVNRFHPEDVGHSVFAWSFRGETGLTITAGLRSPDVELAPGQAFELTSEYQLKPLLPLLP